MGENLRRVLAGMSCALLALCAQAQLTITDGGSPNYSRPIAVPPGIAGLVPNISLVYNAGGVNGVVGYGWTVQGISAITRCGNTKAIDGNVRAVAYTVDDKLCLDGQRLIQTDANGVAGLQLADSKGGTGLVREYRTEKDTYARIRAYGTAGALTTNGPAYFKVWTKSGQVYEYGNLSNASANALVTVPSSDPKAGVATAWAVSRISDLQGNYIDFQYEQRDRAWGSGPTQGNPTPGHEWNLQEIRYTGTVAKGSTPASPPNNKVVFELADRSYTPGTLLDGGEAYRQGSKNVSVRRLNAIRTYINAQPGATPIKVKTVKLAYDNGPITNRSRLRTITECAGEAEAACLPPTSFNYQAGGDEAYTPSPNFNLKVSPAGTPALLGPNSGVISGDFNGDGKTDLLIWADNPASNQLWTSNGDGSFTRVPNGTGAGQFNLTNQNLGRGDACYSTYVQDINGDGLPDLIVVTNIYNKDGYTQCPVRQPVPPLIYFNNGDGSFAAKTYTGPLLLNNPSSEQTLIADGGYRYTRGDVFYFMDIDGDGKLDIVTTTLPEYFLTRTTANMFPGSGMVFLKFGVTWDGTFNQSNQFTTTDPCLSNVCTVVYKGDGNGRFSSIPTNVAYTSLYSFDRTRSFGWYGGMVDIDGDGLTDFVGVVANPIYNQNSRAFRSLGNGDFIEVPWKGDCGLHGEPIDLNGDGSRDCLWPGTNVNDNSGYTLGWLNTLFVATGNAGATQPVYTNLTAVGQGLRGGYPDKPTAGYASLDINGDGRGDLLRWSNDPTQTALYLSNGDGTYTTASKFNLNTADWQLRKGVAISSRPFYQYNADFIAGDFTGQGNVEFLRLIRSPIAGADATTNQLFVKKDPRQPDLLSSVVSSTGLTTTLTWVPLRNSTSGSLGPRYKSDRGTANQATLPNMDITPPMQVVATTVSDTGVGTGQVATEYFYAGLKASYDGRGLQGLRESRRQSYGPNGQPVTVVRQYLQGFPYSGVVKQSETWNGPLNSVAPQVLSRSTYTYCDTTAAAGANLLATPDKPCTGIGLVQRSYTYKKVDQSWELNAPYGALPTVTTLKSFTFGGDPSNITVITTAADNTQAAISSTDNQYFADNTAGDNWILGRVQKSTQSNRAPSAANVGVVPVPTGGQAALSSPAFSDVPLSGSTSATATLTNTGGVALTVVVPTATSVSGAGFSFASTTCTASLAPGASCGITINFAASVLGTNTGSVTVATNVGSWVAPLSVQVLPLMPGAFSLVSGQLNGPASVAVFTNTGNQTITGITASCQNSGYGPPTVYGTNGQPTTTLAPGPAEKISVVAIATTSPSPSPAGYCKVLLRGTNASNSPYYSATY